MQNSVLDRFSSQQLKRAVLIREKIEALEREFSAIMGAPKNVNGGGGGVVRKRRRLSAAARRRIGLATKARWARFRAQKQR